MYIQTKKIDVALKENYTPYAMKVIMSRALPFVYDGLKNGHRKAMQTAHEMDLSPKNKTKSANLVGQTMRLNPHGDGAIYETIVRLTDVNESLLVPLFSGKGNFGKTYSRDMAYAASRYTEIGLSDIAKEFFALFDKDTVDFEDNYDGTKKEAKLLPVTFPNILVNPNQGIAVGMASNICSFNFNEICNATIQILNGSEDISDCITGPDFPTGGIYLLNQKELQSVIKTGRGSLKVRAKYKYDSKSNCIEITEIPYTTTCEAVVDKITELIKLGTIKEISDIRDETDLNGLKITIDVKRGTDADLLMKKLFSSTTLEDTFSCNFNILYYDENGNTRPKVMGVNEILKIWCEWRMNCLVREYVFDLKKKEKEHALLQALGRISADLDKAIEIIRYSESDKESIDRLMKQFELNEIQAEYVSNIRLRKLNAKYVLAKLEEKKKIEDEMTRIQNVISDKDKQKEILIQQIESLAAKYGKERKTSIGVDEGKVKKELLIADYNCSFVLTEQGYFKKNLRYSEQQKTKDGDKVIQTIGGNNKDDILLFSNLGDVHIIKAREIDECSPTKSMGLYLPSNISLQSGEKIVFMTSTHDYTGDMLFAFKNGKIARVSLKSYMAKTNRKKLNGAFSTKSELVRAFKLDKDMDLVAMSSIDKVLVFNTGEINAKLSRTSDGVNVLKSKNGSYMHQLRTIQEVMSELTSEEIDYYRASISAVGKYVKKEHDWTKQQIAL